MKKTIAVLCAISASAVLGADWTYSSNKITDGNWTLSTSTVSNGEDVVLLRLGWTYNKNCRTAGSGELDLTKPIVDATGKIYKITEIGYQAFKSDGSLVKVKLPQELQAFYEGKENSFSGCTNLVELIADVPELETLGNNAFSGCTNLNKMVFKAPKLKKITQFAFQNCPLRDTSFTTDVDFSGVTEVARDAFSQTQENAGPSGRLYLPKIANLNNQNAFTKCARLEAVEIGDKTKNLDISGSGMFSGCTSLKKVVLRGKSFSLGWSENYFDDCPLEEVYFWGTYPKQDWDGLNRMLNKMFKSVPAPVDNVKFCRIYTSTKSGNFPYVALNATEKENIPADIAGSVLGAYAPLSMGNGRCAWVVKWHSPLDGGLTLVVR